MKAIGAKPEEARALILFTLGLETQASAMEKASDLIKEAVERLQSSMPH
jgi:cysteine sulfinate desulfinase/cysteine desulfurase-like protein